MIFESDSLDHDRYIKEVLPVALKYANDMFEDDWTFQQDGARPHIHENSQECCAKNFPSLIDKNHWPPNSPDLNRLDSCVWDKSAQVKHIDIGKDTNCDVKTCRQRDVVACLGPIECSKTKEIILNNKIQHFCSALKSEFFKKKIRSKDWKLTEKVNPSFILAHPLYNINENKYYILTDSVLILEMEMIERRCIQHFVHQTNYY